MTRKTIYSVGSPQNIQLAKMDRVEHPIIGVDNFRPIISFEIKVARYPLRRKANTCFMAQIVNGNGFFLQTRFTTADRQNTADALIVRSMLALLELPGIKTHPTLGDCAFQSAAPYISLECSTFGNSQHENIAHF